MSSSGRDCRVRVMCRVRPLNEKEKGNSSVVVDFPSETTVSLGGRMYSYDHVFKPYSTQSDVYSISARPLVQDVLYGYNATIFAYGQTASGKTHTMEGELNSETSQGIIPRIVADMFEQLYSVDASVEVHIKVSYFEIYMEKIRDLLDVSKTNLAIGETKDKVPYVKGVTERFVTTPEEVLEVIEEGRANRSVSVTNMNAHSSRSHAVFLFNIKQENKESHKTIFGKLYLVDLAGSEKVDKTNAQGLTLEEAKTINKSLLALSNVISALSEGNKLFIPYRDSKLTRVLQESLGGNARTTLIICCSPSSYNATETKSTLMFGDRAKSVRNKVEINVELTAEEWKIRYNKLKDTNSKLRAIVRSYEAELGRWRSGKQVPEEQQQNLTLKDISVDSLCTSPTSMSSGVLSPTHLEEQSRLNAIIEEKEEIIQNQIELIKNVTAQLRALEDLHKACDQENYTLKQQMSDISLELDNSQAEVKEVMQALEELAVSYDTKDKEIERSNSAKHFLEEEIDKLQQSIESKSKELHHLHDTTAAEKRKHQERVTTLFRELHEVGVILGTKLDDQLRKVDPTADLTDEDYTKARIHVSNLRCEVRMLAKQREVLEKAEKEARDKAQAAAVELTTCKNKLSEFETQNNFLISSLRKMEQNKQMMEAALSELKEQLEDLRKREKTLIQKGKGTPPPGMTKKAFKAEMDEKDALHVKEVQQLQEQISKKEEDIASITQQHQEQLVAMNKVVASLQDMHRKYSLEKQQFKDMELQAKVRERLQQDLGGFTDTVSREMERLNEVRERYLEFMSSHVKGKSLDDSSALEVRPLKEFQFLERNLEELDHAHKKAVSENVEMAREIPRLRTILATKSKRIGHLEHMIGETKDAANTEFEKLRSELDQTKQNYQAKLRDKERQSQLASAPQPRHGHSITYVDQLTGLTRPHPIQMQGRRATIDPLTGLSTTRLREPDNPSRGGMFESRSSSKRQGGGTLFGRPVPRRSSDSSTTASCTSREKLMAGAGVSLIGQRPKPTEFDPLGEHEQRTLSHKRPSHY